MGITVYNIHEAEHVKDSDMVIASSAIKKITQSINMLWTME